MAERITHNPHLEIMPNHAGPHYNILWNTLTQNGMTVEQAIQALDNSWNQNHNNWTQRWDQQEINDATATEAIQLQQQQEDERCVAAMAETQTREETADKEKKKMKDFNNTIAVGSYIAPWPAQYTLHQIEDFKYVELWYLTPEGCTDTTQHQKTLNDDTFGLTKIDDVVTLKSISSVKASKNVIPDAELSFHQMLMAKNTLIPLMTKYQWSEKVVNTSAQFFTQLEIHPYHQHELGEQALITYQARVRREWHDQLRLDRMFNIAIINEDLLQNIYKEILDKAQLQSLNEVSTPSQNLSSYELTNDIPFLSYLSTETHNFCSAICIIQHRTTQPLSSCTMHCTMLHAPNMHHTPPPPIDQGLPQQPLHPRKLTRGEPHPKKLQRQIPYKISQWQL